MRSHEFTAKTWILKSCLGCLIKRPEGNLDQPGPDSHTNMTTVQGHDHASVGEWALGELISFSLRDLGFRYKEEPKEAEAHFPSETWRSILFLLQSLHTTPKTPHRSWATGAHSS